RSHTSRPAIGRPAATMRRPVRAPVSWWIRVQSAVRHRCAQRIGSGAVTLSGLRPRSAWAPATCTSRTPGSRPTPTRRPTSRATKVLTTTSSRTGAMSALARMARAAATAPPASRKTVRRTQSLGVRTVCCTLTAAPEPSVSDALLDHVGLGDLVVQRLLVLVPQRPEPVDELKDAGHEGQRLHA